MNSVNRRQRRILKKMLNNKEKTTKQIEREKKIENYQKNLEFIRRKYSRVDTDISPNGGKPMFQKPID